MGAVVNPDREILADDFSARAASLRRARRVHPDNLTASFFRFAREPSEERGPSGVVDRLCKPACCQSLDVQVLRVDDPETGDELPGKVDVVLPADVLDVLVRSRQESHGLSPPGRAPLPLRHTALRPLQREPRQ